MRHIKTRKVICDICGKEFVAAASNVKYCSPECVAIGREYKRDVWNEKHPNYHKRWYKKKKKEKQEAMKKNSLKIDDIQRV